MPSVEPPDENGLALGLGFPISELGLAGLPVSVRLPLNGLPSTPIPMRCCDGPDSDDEEVPSEELEDRVDERPVDEVPDGGGLSALDPRELPPIGIDGDVIVPVIGLPRRPMLPRLPVDELPVFGLHGAAGVWLDPLT